MPATPTTAGLLPLLVLAAAALCTAHEKNQSPPLEPTGPSPAGEAAADDDAVSIVIASDANLVVGLGATLRSVVSTCPPSDRARLRIYTVVPAGKRKAFERFVRCALNDSGAAKVSVVEFDPARWMRRAPIGLPYRRSDLASTLNYARFYLPQLLGPAVRKVLWLDADVITVRCAAALYDSALRGPAAPVVAAVPRNRSASMRLGAYVETDHEIVRSTKPQLHAAMPSFNAGVMVIDLRKWSQTNSTPLVEWWMRQNKEHKGIYNLGSQPPLLLLFADTFEHLDPRWNVDGLGLRGSPRPGVAEVKGGWLLHWSGAVKPWVSHRRGYKVWLRHAAPNRCRVPGMPEPRQPRMPAPRQRRPPPAAPRRRR
eukprot:TRINITY_DN1912_c0_g1_i7.p1 TRINITY_DN1912_c0_g1~~TRINITY_DN1912_c0_g1_i7.p1  ORF type:complete len:369 (+),score=68.58 TRINITY_DN1912_c0_g1_i7:73-1179(+)